MAKWDILGALYPRAMAHARRWADATTELQAG